MIEGLRLLPWFQSAERDEPNNVSHMKDCGDCMLTRTVAQRQDMACGYESPTEHGYAWRHRGFSCSVETQPTICPGYTTRLPEVSEVAEWFALWKHFGAAIGPKPSAGLRRLALMLGAEVGALEGWRINNPKKAE